MILASLIGILILGGLAAAILGRFNASYARWASLAALLANSWLALTIWSRYSKIKTFMQPGDWVVEWSVPWIPPLGIEFHLGIDGLSLILVSLTLFIGMLAVLASWTEIDRRVGLFHLNLMWVLAGIVGVFLALDLFLFYFFWELMLIPMYVLISVWGHENRVYASYKFFLFTQAGGLLMLIAILGLYAIHGQSAGEYTFDYNALLAADLSSASAWWLMWGFIIAFAVKLPAVPLHTWLPDAHTQAPTAGSVLLAGLLLKTGAYGLMRIALPLFPHAAERLAPVAMAIGVVGILYGAVLAFAQTDFKRLVAYTSVSHMGFVLVGVFSMNVWAYQGVVMQMIAHGLSASALFIVAGMLQKRLGVRDLGRLGGLWLVAPRLSGAAMIFVMASLGLPGLANFVAEFLILIGAFHASPVIASSAAIGLILATVYSLKLMHETFFGPNKQQWRMPDANPRELFVMAVIVIALVILGMRPQPVFNAARPAIEAMPSAAQNIEMFSSIDMRENERGSAQ